MLVTANAVPSSTISRNMLVTANHVPSSTILVTVMTGALSSSKALVLTRTTRHNISEDAILQSDLEWWNK
jgi:hypothetical protein